VKREQKIISKPVMEGSPVLPDIDKQIRYIKHLRQDVVPRIRNLQTELDMIMAIEQSLIAAKLLTESQPLAHPSSEAHANATQLLKASGIKLTSARIEVLRVILSQAGKEFTVSGVHKAILKYRPISKSAVIATLLLLKEKGLISESSADHPSRKRIGRPERKFRYQGRT